ncbi:hypothetical protein GW17_00003218 [Ensete ventricosum]|nr:hypothetical protein GW17_00003218 [Ensete ventricosum]
MRRRGAVLLRLAVLLPLLLLTVAPGAAGVWLNLPASGTKCVSEEIQPNVVVLADYAVVHEGHDEGAIPTIAAKVSPSNASDLLFGLVPDGEQGPGIRLET